MLCQKCKIKTNSDILNDGVFLCDHCHHSIYQSTIRQTDDEWAF